MKNAPKSVSNILFFNYEQKAKYLLELKYDEGNLSRLIENTALIANIKHDNEIVAPAFCYLNRIHYILNADIEKEVETLTNLSEAKSKVLYFFLKHYFDIEIEHFKSMLLDNYKIDIENTEFILDNGCTYAINGDNRTLINKFDGMIYCNYFIYLYSNESFIDLLLDIVGDSYDSLQPNIKEFQTQR